MFRRTKHETPVATGSQATVTKPGGKGRPTPTRKEAEAAARARAKTPRTRKELARAQRQARTESSQRIRAAMKAGDERYYLARDRGPVRRFVRDFVDSRFSITDVMIPMLVLSMVLGYSGNQTLQGMSNVIVLTTLLLVVTDMVIIRFRLRRELARRFPEDSHRGTTYYALTRALQMKFMRLPKPQVKIGERLPEHYR